MFSIYYIASKSNQVCLWLPYVLNTTYSFPFCCGRHGSGLVLTWWPSALQCTGTTFVLIVLIRNVCCQQPALKGEGRFASWVILIGCAKTDEPVTGNITGSFCIFLLVNPTWPSYVVLHDRLAIKRIKLKPDRQVASWSKLEAEV